MISETYCVSVSKDTIWQRLREAGLTYQKPEREYYELDEGSQQEWLRKDVPKIRKTAEKHSQLFLLSRRTGGMGAVRSARKFSANIEEWDDCLRCPEFEHCYKLCMGKMALEAVIVSE